MSVKVIRNKQTGQPEGYGFLEFRSRASAEQVLQSYNGAPMPNGEQNFRLNWATLGAGERRTDDSPDYTIFVGDLAADVTDYLLQETFKPHYSSVKGAKVVTDRTTGRSKGYGFVRFGDETEQMRAMSEMNGALCSTRPMRIGPAATKKPIGGGQQYEKGMYIVSLICCLIFSNYNFKSSYITCECLQAMITVDAVAIIIILLLLSKFLVDLFNFLLCTE